MKMKRNLCPICQKNPARNHSMYGLTACSMCAQGVTTASAPGVETEDIREQQKSHSDDMLQPYREGVLSKEYVDKYGTKHLDIQEGETPKNVWDTYYPEE